MKIVPATAVALVLCTALAAGQAPDAELRAIWATAEGVGARSAPFGRYIRFLLLTATRRNEAADARWSEIADGVWTIPAARYKTAVDHVVPLSKAAMAIIAPSIDGHGFYVLPFDSPNAPLFGPPPIRAFSRHTAALRIASGTTGWRLHRTARSLMSRAGVAPDIAERCPGHVIPGVRGVYDRHEYLEEKRRAFEALAGLVEGITHQAIERGGYELGR